MRTALLTYILWAGVTVMVPNDAYPDPPLAGFSASVFNGNEGCDFELYQLYGTYHFTDLYKSVAVSMPIGFEAALGILRESCRPAFSVHGNLQLGVSILENRITFLCGSGPTMISRCDFPSRDLGSIHHFTSFFGMRVAQWRLGAGVRFQHMSNGNQNRRNPGVNLIVVEMYYRFIRGGD